MKYLNLYASLGRHPSMLQATNEQSGVWFKLICYCHEQMNSGVIQCCHDWPDRTWAAVAGTTAAFVAQESPLWHMSAMVMVVHHYNVDAETAYKRKQEMGRIYIERRWNANREKNIIKITSSNSKKSGNPQKDNAS